MQTQPINGMTAAANAIADPVPVARNAVRAPASSEIAAPSPHRVEEAVTEANRAMKAIDATLQFEVDPDTQITVIKVIDTDGKTVLRQVPAQEMLEIAQSLDPVNFIRVRRVVGGPAPERTTEAIERERVEQREIEDWLARKTTLLLQGPPRL